MIVGSVGSMLKADYIYNKLYMLTYFFLRYLLLNCYILFYLRMIAILPVTSLRTFEVEMVWRFREKCCSNFWADFDSAREIRSYTEVE